MATVNDLLSILRRDGVMPARDLLRLLETSPATLSRLVAAADGQVIRLGRTRGARYALRRSVPRIGAVLPTWEIDRQGAPQPLGELHLLEGGACWFSGPEGSGHGRLYEGLPPFVVDMAPQGYLGRAFAQRYPELALPPRLLDWSDEHRLQAIALRGEDVPGNLVIGETAMNRWLERRTQPQQLSDYPAISRDLARQGAGSSAAGEFPKFTAYDGEHHLLVKFTSGDGSPADRRWQDLLVCEAIAGEVLDAAGIPAAASRIRQVGGQLFLEVERFDRDGERGRLPVMSLAAIDDEYYGRRDNWAAAAERLHADGRIPGEDADRLRFLEAFGSLVANTDRHFGNISFYWNPRNPDGEWRLAPVYDMLPMQFTPAAGGMVVEQAYAMPSPKAALLPVWGAALAAARQFWRSVREDERISPAFREIAAAAEITLRQ